VFVSGIKDLQMNYDDESPSMLATYKFPLKTMKFIDNLMKASSCESKFNNILYIARDFSSENP